MKKYTQDKEIISLFSMKKIDDKTKEKLHKAIDNNNFYEISKLTDVLLGQEIWFGDYFEGDEFKFYLNGFRHYQPTRESIDKFLRDENRIITDGKSSKIYSPEEIWQMVDDSKGGKTIEDVVKEMSESQQALIDAEEWIRPHGLSYEDIAKYKPRYNEFHNDGLRFYI